MYTTEGFSVPVATMEYYVGSDTLSGSIRFSTLNSGNQQREERLSNLENGNIGIGTGSPKSKLEISNGDIYIDDINSGVIMKSPDGTCWRMKIDNNGDWVKEQLSECPD